MSGAASGQGGKKQYAKGTHAVAECQRSGQKMRYKDLVEDGHIEGLLVHPDWWEPKHPQEVPITVTDPIALYRPAPEISIESDWGDPDINYGVLPTAPIIFDDFNRPGPDPGPQWEDAGLITNNPYFTRPTIGDSQYLRSNDGPGGGGPLNSVFHTDLLPVDHWAEVELANVNAGTYLVAANITVRATGGLDADGNGIDSGFYAYLIISPYYGYVKVSISRWDAPNIYSFGNEITVNNTGILPDGTIFGIAAINHELYAYVDQLDGNGKVYYHGFVYDPAQNLFRNPDFDFDLVGSPVGYPEYFEQQRIGIGMEGYTGASIDFNSFSAGGINTKTDTLLTTLTGGETRVYTNTAFNIGPFAEWIGIALDGGGWHMSRLNTGYSSGGNTSPVFHVEFNTPFPAGSTATAGNSYYIGGGR